MKIRRAVAKGGHRMEIESAMLADGALSPDQILVESECSFISAGTELSICTGIDAGTRTPAGAPLRANDSPHACR